MFDDTLEASLEAITNEIALRKARENLIDYETFINSKLFLTQTMFIKSQLKRAFTLYKEFEASR